MAKKKKAWDMPNIKDEAKKATPKSKTESNPVGKDNKPRKMIRINEAEHTMAKTVFKLEGFDSMQSYIENLISNDVKTKYKTIYNKIK